MVVPTATKMDVKIEAPSCGGEFTVRTASLKRSTAPSLCDRFQFRSVVANHIGSVSEDRDQVPGAVCISFLQAISLVL
jgi:hypothetical protein